MILIIMMIVILYYIIVKLEQIPIIKQHQKMQQIQSRPGKLFYLTYQLFKESSIDNRGKQLLKDMIITNNQQIASAYEGYVKSGTELTLKNDLFRICKSERELQKMEGLSDRSRKSKSFKGNMSIKVPPKNIQKVPAMLREF